MKSVVGEGSTFTVRLPRRKDVFLNDKNVQFYTQDSESDIIPDSMPVFVDEGNSPIELIETKDTENKTHTVLLVEDNDELLQVLKELSSLSIRSFVPMTGKKDSVRFMRTLLI